MGNNIHRLTGTVSIIASVLVGVIILACLLFLHRNEQRLEDEAERALPGPLGTHPLRLSETYSYPVQRNEKQDTTQMKGRDVL